MLLASSNGARTAPCHPARSLGSVPSPLPLTGERTVPGIAREQYWFARHEVVYRWLAAPLPRASASLEAGSGEGYGAQILREAGARVVAVDYDGLAIEHSAATYRLPHVRANLAALPFAPRRRRRQPAGDRAPVGPARASCARSRRIARWTCSEHTQPAHLLPRPGPRARSPPTRSTSRSSTPNNCMRPAARSGFHRRIEMFGVHHGARLSQRPSLIAEQIDASLSGVWPAELEAIRRGVTVERLHRSRATTWTPAWTSWWWPR